MLNQVRKRKAVSGEVDFGRIGDDQADAPATLANTEEAHRLRKMIWSAPAEYKCGLYFSRIWRSLTSLRSSKLSAPR
jgi:hypothetical protein